MHTFMQDGEVVEVTESKRLVLATLPFFIVALIGLIQIGGVWMGVTLMSLWIGAAIFVWLNREEVPIE